MRKHVYTYIGIELYYAKTCHDIFWHSIEVTDPNALCTVIATLCMSLSRRRQPPKAAAFNIHCINPRVEEAAVGGLLFLH